MLRYVERNPLRAGLVERAEEWPWGSLHRRMFGTPEEQAQLAESPVRLGRRWCEHVNQAQNEAEEQAIRRSIARGQPYGGDAWQTKVTRQLNLEHTFRPRGRPKKSEPASKQTKSTRK